MSNATECKVCKTKFIVGCAGRQEWRNGLCAMCFEVSQDRQRHVGLEDDARDNEERALVEAHEAVQETKIDPALHAEVKYRRARQDLINRLAEWTTGGVAADAVVDAIEEFATKIRDKQ